MAREYHVSEAELAQANQLRAGESLQGVEALAIPLAPVAAPSTHMTLYTARRGDTLVTIADRFGVSLNELRRWNNITGIKVEPGRRLHVGEPAHVSRSSRSHRSASGTERRKGARNGFHSRSKERPPAQRSGRTAKSRHTPQEEQIFRAEVKTSKVTHFILVLRWCLRSCYCYNGFRKRSTCLSVARRGK